MKLLKRFTVDCDLRNKSNMKLYYANEGDLFKIDDIIVTCNRIRLVFKLVENRHVAKAKHKYSTFYRVCYRDPTGKHRQVSIGSYSETGAKTKWEELGYGGHITSIYKMKKDNKLRSPRSSC